MIIINSDPLNFPPNDTNWHFRDLTQGMRFLISATLGHPTPAPPGPVWDDVTTWNVPWDSASGPCKLSTITTRFSLVDILKNTPTDQYSPCLTNIVRQVIIPPSELPYNLVDGTREHSHGQAQLIKKLFRGMVGIKYS